MRVHVIGGHGFLGRWIVKQLCATGQHHVTVLDVQSKPKMLASLSYDSANVDILDRDVLRSVMWDHVDVVIHMVGLADVQAAQRNPAFSFRLNIEALVNVLEVCRENQIKRLVVPSTASVYGASPQVPVSETDTPMPTNIYACHKLVAELFVKGYQQNFGVDYTILRLFNVYGRGNLGVIDQCVRKAKNGEALTLFGADQLRDFVYVGDVASAFTASISNPNCVNQTINIGSGVGMTIRQVASLVEKQFPQWNLQFAEKPDFVPYNSIADIGLANQLLNFQPHATEEFFSNVLREEYIQEESIHE